VGYYMGDYYMAGGPLSSGLKLALRSPTLKRTGAAMAGKLAKAGGKLIRRKLKGKLHLGGVRHHRRMHATNVRALRRSLTRIKAFERIARRVLTITHGKTPHTRFKLHHKKR